MTISTRIILAILFIGVLVPCGGELILIKIKIEFNLKTELWY